MLQIYKESFLELVSNRFGRLPPTLSFEELAGKFGGLRDETDFDLFLWSLAHQLKVDTEELLRQLGERWVLEQVESEPLLQAGAQPYLQAADWLLTQSGLLVEAPLLGMQEFVAEVMSRGPNAMRVVCKGPRRCCSFLEGALRAMGELNGESLRYVRHALSASLVDLHLKTFEKP